MEIGANVWVRDVELSWVSSTVISKVRDSISQLWSTLFIPGIMSCLVMKLFRDKMEINEGST